MFPNSQDALPLPLRPNLEQYRKLAKELTRAAKSGNAETIRAWATRWIESLAGLAHSTAMAHFGDAKLVSSRVNEFVRQTLLGGSAEKASLTGAQFVLARCHGFARWETFAEHLDRLTHADSTIAQFESAADAIVGGDLTALELLLRANPCLIQTRSTREHHATLLHYVSANGVENYRQKTPPNIVQIAEALLRAGATVDAEAKVYGGGATALALVATSGPPREAGVQIPLMEKLLENGAKLAPKSQAGKSSSLIAACLANGHLRAAELLADRGAPVDLEAAAGLGLLDKLKSGFGTDGFAASKAAKSQLERGMFWACEYGRVEVVEFMLDRGFDIKTGDRNGQTALHWAVIGGSYSVTRLLLERKAPIEARNAYGGTVLGQALWSAENGGKPETYDAIVKILIDAGARPSDDRETG